MKMKPTTALQAEATNALFESCGLPPYDAFLNFPMFTPRRALARFLVHYELFSKVADLPGAIIDLGVQNGGSTFTWAKLCEIFCPTDILKRVYAFDTFSGFPDIGDRDGPKNPETGRVVGGYRSTVRLEDLRRGQEVLAIDKHIRDVERIRFIPGDVCTTLPQFVDEMGEGLRICLLNLDLDLYHPTRVALECLVPRMVRGGIIIFDEYAHPTFGGESAAVDEYFRSHFTASPKLVKFPWHSNPSAYWVVE